MHSIVLGNSITRGMTVVGCRVVTIPGLDWKGANKYMLEHREELWNTVVYILIGPTRFTRRTSERKEVVLSKPVDTIPQMFRTYYTSHSHLHIRPVLCTIYPMNFQTYNEKQTRRPIMRGFYDEWNREIRGMTVIENRSICAFNEQNGYKTPYIHRRIFHRHGQRYSFREHLLTDGLHPKSVIRSEWAREIKKCINTHPA